MHVWIKFSVAATCENSSRKREICANKILSVLKPAVPLSEVWHQYKVIEIVQMQKMGLVCILAGVDFYFDSYSLLAILFNYPFEVILSLTNFHNNEKSCSLF